ncbi:hypothetical protein NW754_011393 [Fusarium falciforme]|nr:hypothetical protein NW754_011393 [Fusarium falciforme]
MPSPTTPPAPTSIALDTPTPLVNDCHTVRVKRLQEAKLAKDQSLQGINKAEKEKEYKKRYNSAARKWTASIIALPILLVTSYYLFDRLVRGNKQKEMPKQPAALGGMPEPR